jgi:hypothetical protein
VARKANQARSAWNHDKNRAVPAGRLNRSQVRLDTSSKNFGRPSGTAASLHRYPGTSCLATIMLSLRDKAIRSFFSDDNFDTGFV